MIPCPLSLSPLFPPWCPSVALRGRLYGMHMRNLSEDELAASGRSRNGRQYPMGLHQSGECSNGRLVAVS